MKVWWYGRTYDIFVLARLINSIQYVYIYELLIISRWCDILKVTPTGETYQSFSFIQFSLLLFFNGRMLWKGTVGRPLWLLLPCRATRNLLKFESFLLGMHGMRCLFLSWVGSATVNSHDKLFRFTDELYNMENTENENLLRIKLNSRKIVTQFCRKNWGIYTVLEYGYASFACCLSKIFLSRWKSRKIIHS